MAWGAPRGVDDLIAKLRDNTTVSSVGGTVRTRLCLAVSVGVVQTTRQWVYFSALHSIVRLLLEWYVASLD